MSRLIPAVGLALVVLALAAFPTPVPAQAPQTAPPTGPPPVSLSALIDQTRALFPRIEGDVVEAKGTVLTISAGSATGVRPGLTLEVFRQGREIVHPKTGKVLGREEETVGHATVTQVFDGYSLARLDGDGARPGDRFRGDAGKVRLTLLALPGLGVKTNLIEAATNEIYEGLSRTGRFQVMMGDQVNVWLAEQKMDADQFLEGHGVKEASAKFKIDNLLVVRFKQAERKPFMDVRLFSLGKAEPLLTTAFFVPPSIKPVQPGRFSASDRARPDAPVHHSTSLLARLLGLFREDVGYSGGGESIPLREVARFPFTVVSMDVSVSPKDQIPRVAVTDGESVYVYKLIDRSLQGEWTYNARSLGRIISVQLADLLGDGTFEAVVNRFDTRVGMNSLIVGVQNGKPTALVDHVNYLLLAMDEKATGVKRTLWGQQYREETFFDKGKADLLTLHDGKLDTARRLSVPDNFRATGTTFTNITGKGQEALAYIDEYHRLHITIGNDEVWRSSSPVGGGGQKIEVFRQLEASGRSFFYYMEPTPLAVDLDGDGVQELVVPQNQQEGLLAVVYRTAAGMRFQQVNTGFEGVIGAMGAIPAAEAGEAPTLIAAVVRYNSFLKVKGETQIIMTIPTE